MATVAAVLLWRWRYYQITAVCSPEVAAGGTGMTQRGQSPTAREVLEGERVTGVPQGSLELLDPLGGAGVGQGNSGMRKAGRLGWQTNAHTGSLVRRKGNRHILKFEINEFADGTRPLVSTTLCQTKAAGYCLASFRTPLSLQTPPCVTTRI